MARPPRAQDQGSRRSSAGPIAWAVAIVLVVVAVAYAAAIVMRCQASEFAFLDALSVKFGKCQAPPDAPVLQPRPADGASAVTTPSIRKLSRSDLPCPLVWLFLGRYSRSRAEYETPGYFDFLPKRGPGLPYPKAGDEIVIKVARSMIVPGFGTSTDLRKCDRMLDAPKDYRQQIAPQFEAGKISPNTQVLVNRMSLLPSETAEPVYVWALVGPSP